MKPSIRNLRRELAVYRLALKHPHTPRRARWLLWLALGYLASPVDIIPDFIPIIGHLDDLIVVPWLIRMVVQLIPPDVLAECRRQAAQS